MVAEGFLPLLSRCSWKYHSYMMIHTQQPTKYGVTRRNASARVATVTLHCGHQWRTPPVHQPVTTTGQANSRHDKTIPVPKGIVNDVILLQHTADPTVPSLSMGMCKMPHGNKWNKHTIPSGDHTIRIHTNTTTRREQLEGEEWGWV